MIDSPEVFTTLQRDIKHDACTETSVVGDVDLRNKTPLLLEEFLLARLEQTYEMAFVLGERQSAMPRLPPRWEDAMLRGCPPSETLLYSQTLFVVAFWLDPRREPS